MKIEFKKHLVQLFLSFCLVSTLFGQEIHEEKILRIAGQLNRSQREDVRIEKLEGGLTNVNYKVDSGKEHYFFRCVTGGNDFLGCSLAREWQVTSKVAAIGLAPKVLFYSPEEGVLVTEYIETIEGKVDLRDKETMRKFCHLVSALHALEIEFPTLFCPFETIKEYVDKALQLGFSLPESVNKRVLPKIARLKKRMPLLMKVARKPTHLDLHSGNVLDDGQKLWLVDWEYAAMGDPFFDLATAASVENLSDPEMHQLLEHYLGRRPTPNEFHYFYSMRFLADARWALWSYIQAKVSLLDEPFEQHGDLFLEHCLERINPP